MYNLPFQNGFFDAIYMIAVIGEIPEPDKAMREFHRVLSPSGTLAFSELLLDPDYPRVGTLIRKAASAGFHLKKKVGNFFYYTLIFEKGDTLSQPIITPGKFVGHDSLPPELEGCSLAVVGFCRFYDMKHKLSAEPLSESLQDRCNHSWSQGLDH